MRKIVLKLIGGLFLAGLVLFGGFLADAVLNESRIFYAAIGRDAIEQACAHR